MPYKNKKTQFAHIVTSDVPIFFRYFLIFSFAILAFPLFVYASSVNINTANLKTLQTLPGIGATKAQSIIDYRTKQGLFSNVTDIQKVNGIGQYTYSKIASLISVKNKETQAKGTDVKKVVVDTSADTQHISTTDTAYVPIPRSISVSIDAKTIALVEVPFTLRANVKTDAGAVDSSARVQWSFGDGSASDGRIVTKTYHYSGTYRVVAIASDGERSARAEMTVKISPASIRIASVSGDGITLANDADTEIDISNWRIATSKGIFRIPIGTTILSKSRVLFPFSIMNLPVAWAVTLMYPDGIIASVYKPQHVATRLIKPLVEHHSFHKVQGGDSVGHTKSLSIRKTIARVTEATGAPAVLANASTAGAPVASSSFAKKVSSQIPTKGKLTNNISWTVGFVGVFALVGSALMFI